MVELTPERAIEIQALLGADISMQLDECLRLPATREEIERAMQLSLRWAERCKRAFESKRARAMRCSASCRAATIMRLRERKRARADRYGFDGYAIGGLAVGEPQEVMLKIVEETAPLLPADAPALSDGRRHAARSRWKRLRAASTCSTACCRRATAATAWPSRASAPINLANARHANDPRPLDEQSAHPAARTYSRAYLHHLTKANEMLGAVLLSTINLAYYQAADGRHARGDRGRAVRGVPRRDDGRLGARGYSAACHPEERSAPSSG